MQPYRKSVEMRWADLDANQHVTHSKYYELGAHCRMGFLVEKGFTTDWFRAQDLGVILFREECVFRRELHAGEQVNVTMQLTRCRKDGSRWSVRHEILKQDGTVAAVIQADLAWMQVSLRKLTAPPQEMTDRLLELERSEDFS